MSKKTAIIVDLDATLFDIKHRLPLITGIAKDYYKFHSLIHLDTANSFIVEAIRILCIKGGRSLVFITGRPEWCRKKTEKAIRKVLDFCIEYELHMKPNEKSKQNQVEYKVSVYKANVEKKYDVQFFFDDNEAVSRAYHKLGLVGMTYKA